MAGQFVKMTMSDGAEIAVYHVEPRGERRGGLVVIQEIFGINSHIRDVAEGFAREGYEVLAPALFDREHPGFEVGYAGEDFARAVQLARQLHPFDVTIADTRTCIEALAAKGGPVFITGYCYGGSVAWVAAQTIDGLAAASGYYGSRVPDTAGVAPKCPTILHFGRHDAGIPLEGVEKVIAAHHPNVEVYLYDAGHGFNCDQRESYEAESAALAKRRTLDLFRANGG